MRKSINIIGLVGASMVATAGGFAGAMARRADAQARKIFGAENIGRFIQQYGRSTNWQRKSRGSLTQGRRHGGEHLHSRERARRLFKPGPERQAFYEGEQLLVRSR